MGRLVASTYFRSPERGRQGAQTTLLEPNFQLPEVGNWILDPTSNDKLPTSGSWVSTSRSRLLNSGSRMSISNFQLPGVGCWRLQTAHFFPEGAPRRKLLFALSPTHARGRATRQTETSHLPSRRPAASPPPPTLAPRGHSRFFNTLGDEMPIQGCTSIRYDSWPRVMMHASYDTRGLRLHGPPPP